MVTWTNRHQICSADIDNAILWSKDGGTDHLVSSSFPGSFNYSCAEADYMNYIRTVMKEVIVHYCIAEANFLSLSICIICIRNLLCQNIITHCFKQSSISMKI